MRYLEFVLAERDIIERLLTSFLKANSKVHHPIAGYVLSKSSLDDFKFLFEKLTYDIAPINLAYLNERFISDKLDERYFEEDTLPISEQSSHYVKDCMTVKIFEWVHSCE